MYYSAVVMVGCAGYTVKIEPPPKKPAKKSDRVSHSARPRKTPTPKAEKPEHNKPMQLEPTKTPTPIIQLPPTVWQQQHIHPTDFYL